MNIKVFYTCFFFMINEYEKVLLLFYVMINDYDSKETFITQCFIKKLYIMFIFTNVLKNGLVIKLIILLVFLFNRFNRTIN